MGKKDLSYNPIELIQDPSAYFQLKATNSLMIPNQEKEATAADEFIHASHKKGSIWARQGISVKAGPKQLKKEGIHRQFFYDKKLPSKYFQISLTGEPIAGFHEKNEYNQLYLEMKRIILESKVESKYFREDMVKAFQLILLEFLSMTIDSLSKGKTLHNINVTASVFGDMINLVIGQLTLNEEVMIGQLGKLSHVNGNYEFTPSGLLKKLMP